MGKGLQCSIPSQEGWKDETMMRSGFGKGGLMGVATVLAAGALLSHTPAAEAAELYFASDRLAYSGTVTRYATLADAQAASNPLGTYSITTNNGNRDLALYLTDDGNGNREAYILTAWYYTTTGGPYSGVANPSNVQEGFFQIGDIDGNTVTSMTGFFNSDGTQFTLQVAGSGAHRDPTQTPHDSARLWAPTFNGSMDLSFGYYHSYALDLTLNGLNGVNDNGLFTSNGEPTSVTGTFTAIFENLNYTYSPTKGNAAAEGFYVANFTIHMDSWAWSNLGSLKEPFTYTEITAVPEPASFGVLGVAALGLLARRRAAVCA